MKQLTLRLRITLLCGIILIGTAVVLTIISVRNADSTYTKQLSMNLEDKFNTIYDEKVAVFSGEDGEKINEALKYAKQFIPDDKKRTVVKALTQSNPKEIGRLFKGAEKKFMAESILVATIFVMTGLFFIYLIVGKALKPVRELSDTVKNINENNLYEKIEEPTTNDEIGCLTTSYNQMLERLSTSFEIQKNYAANAAHEFRTPLATIKAGIQVLELDEEPSVAEYKEAIEIARESNERLIQIVDNLLLLTQETQQNFSELVLIEKLFMQIQKELTPKAKKSEVSLVILNTAGVLRGNQTLIYRAIYNLVENGIKYCKKGGTVILDSIEHEKTVVITVSDNGIGIPAESLGHIFEPFYRVDKSRSRAIEGSGLGLSIVKGIIEKHKGTIRVDSSEGKGATFTIELSK